MAVACNLGAGIPRHYLSLSAVAVTPLVGMFCLPLDCAAHRFKFEDGHSLNKRDEKLT